MTKDPIIEEIHQMREKMWEESGSTLEGYIQTIEKGRETYRDRLVSLEDFRSRHQPSKPNPKTADK